MIKLLKDVGATITLEVRSRNGDLIDADDGTDVVVTTKDGADELVVTGDAIHESLGKYTFDLTPTNNAVLDAYRNSWAVTLDAAVNTFITEHAVAGGYYFSIQEAREFDKQKLDNAEKYTGEAIAAARDLVEEELEKWCDVAFVPRTKRVTFHNEFDELILNDTFIRHIMSGTLNGDALELTGWTYHLDDGIFERDGGFKGDVTLFYEYGLGAPPAGIKRAALLLLHDRLISSNIDPRVTTFTDEAGTRQFGSPGPDKPSGIPEVDAAVNEWRESDFIGG